MPLGRIWRSTGPRHPRGVGADTAGRCRGSSPSRLSPPSRDSFPDGGCGTRRSLAGLKTVRAGVIRRAPRPRALRIGACARPSLSGSRCSLARTPSADTTHRVDQGRRASLRFVRAVQTRVHRCRGGHAKRTSRAGGALKVTPSTARLARDALWWAMICSRVKMPFSEVV